MKTAGLNQEIVIREHQGLKLKSRQELGLAQRWVIKIGSAMITNDGQGLDRLSIEAWVAQARTRYAQAPGPAVAAADAPPAPETVQLAEARR